MHMGIFLWDDDQTVLLSTVA